MNFTTIKFEQTEPGIGQITLCRPERLNAINFQMLDEMHQLYEELFVNEEIRVIILVGQGRGFCSGADLMDEKLSSEAERYFPDPASFLARVQKKYSRLIVELKRLPQPIIAAVQGAAAGGGLCMALASDVIYAGPRAKFIPSFINIGLSGGELGTSYFLPRMIGSVRAAEILMTGRAVLAEEAERIGLINRVVEEESLLKTAYDTARIMLTKSVTGLKQTKEILIHNLNAPSLDSAIEFENRNQSICAFSPDFKAAVEAFIIGKKD